MIETDKMLQFFMDNFGVTSEGQAAVMAILALLGVSTLLTLITVTGAYVQDYGKK
jgi:hypothetical protein